MVAEAESCKEVMVKHGLSDTMLQSLAQSLDEFDPAVERGIAGRLVHVAASAGLDEVADEVVLIVKAIGGLNRVRFENEPGLLAQWASAMDVLATPRITREVAA